MLLEALAARSDEDRVDTLFREWYRSLEVVYDNLEDSDGKLAAAPRQACSPMLVPRSAPLRGVSEAHSRAQSAGAAPGPHGATPIQGVTLGPRKIGRVWPPLDP